MPEYGIIFSDLINQGWKIHYETLEFGSLGHHRKDMCNLLSMAVDLPKKLLDRCAKAAISCSYQIFLARNFPSWTCIPEDNSILTIIMHNFVIALFVLVMYIYIYNLIIYLFFLSLLFEVILPCLTSVIYEMYARVPECDPHSSKFYFGMVFQKINSMETEYSGTHY